MNYEPQILPEFSKLKIAPLLGGTDMNMENPPWEEATFRVCITQNGDFFTKSTSATIIQLAALAREAERMLADEFPGVKFYVDFAFQPDPEDTQILRDKGIKEVFGWCSMHSLDEFDIILASFSIHYESMSIAPMLWGAGLPAHYYERLDHDCPLILAGGVVGQLIEPVFGAKAGSLIDLLCLGEAEDRLPQIIMTIFRHRELLKGEKRDKMGLIRMLVETYDNAYFPNGYDHIYGEKGTDKEHKITEIKRLYDWVPAKVKFHRSWNPRPPMFEDRVMLTTNDGASRGELQISHGCMGFGACYFCAEGNEAGTWREYDLQGIVENMERLKMQSAPNVISFFSFNTNYYSRIFDLYHEVAKRFNYISVIAFRADVVSAVPEYITFLKALGTFRLTVALEGISERIRGAFLNKNLTWEQALRTAEYVFKEKFVMLKWNLIFTGHEEPEDIEEFCLAMAKMNELKQRYGAKTSIVWSMTTLVTYWNVGLQWQPRKATLAEIFQRRLFKVAVQRGRILGHRFRFNSGPEFVWQQFLVDGGRRIGDIALPQYREAWERNEAINTGGFFEKMNSRIMQGLGLDTDEKITAFFDRHYDFDELHPSSTFDILPRFVQKIYYMAVGKRGTKYCLRSPATPDTKCKTCGFCEDDNYSQREIVKREFTSSKTVLDVETAIFGNKPRSRLRVIYRVLDQSVPGVDDKTALLARHRFKIASNHFVAARFLRAMPEALNANFHSCGEYSDYVPTFHDQPDSWGGVGFFEIYLRCYPQELQAAIGDGKQLIQQVNAMCTLHKVVSVIPMGVTSSDSSGSSRKNIKHIYRFKTRFGREDLVERFAAYNGKMKLMDKGASAVAQEVEEPYSRDEFGLYMVQMGKETHGIFTLFFRYNPFMALRSFFGFKLNDIRSHFVVDRVGATEIVDMACQSKNCGKRSGVNILTNKPQELCPDCMAKLMATKMQQTIRSNQTQPKLVPA